MITLVNREKRQIVGYDIAFDKSRERIQKLVDSSPKADPTILTLILLTRKFVIMELIRHYIFPLRRKSK